MANELRAPGWGQEQAKVGAEMYYGGKGKSNPSRESQRCNRTRDSRIRKQGVPQRNQHKGTETILPVPFRNVGGLPGILLCSSSLLCGSPRWDNVIHAGVCDRLPEVLVQMSKLSDQGVTIGHGIAKHLRCLLQVII